MSTVKTNNVQVGQSVTATNNFTLYQPSTPDGTVRLGLGNAGVTTADVVSFSSAGMNAAGLAGDIAAARITTALNATGSAPIYAARAWVNFNGTGTPAIRASGNVSSITDNGVGDYTVNFTTAMPNVDYSLTGTAGSEGDAPASIHLSVPATTSARVRLAQHNVGPVDRTFVCIAIFR